MSATLEWFCTGLGTKTGTAVGNFFADVVTLAGTFSANSDFLWEVKGSNTGSTPYYISFGLKDGSPGRVAFIMWTSGPAGNNSAILDGAPTTNVLYCAWFPNGTGTTLANLTASSGAITGDDTNCVKVATGPTLSTFYAANYQPWYFECQEGVFLGAANPASSTYGCGGGNLVVDGADDAYGATVGWANNASSTFGSNSAGIASWTSSANAAGTGTSAMIRTNYGSSNRVYYHAYLPSGAWATSAQSSTDILSNNQTQEFWFAPVALLGLTKGEGTTLKLRQIGWGPGAIAQFQPYYETGPEVRARQCSGATAGGNGHPWFTNEKL
jgi:hypothetical protein